MKVTRYVIANGRAEAAVLTIGGWGCGTLSFAKVEQRTRYPDCHIYKLSLAAYGVKKVPEPKRRKK